MMEEVKDKPKRICCRPGNVFCIEVEGFHKRFFQYLGRDYKFLGGKLIRVFKKRYPMEYEPVIEDIISDEVDFYYYTWVYSGVKDGFWYRVGTSKNLGNLDSIFFLSELRTLPEVGVYSEKWELVEAFTGKEIFLGKLPVKYQILEWQSINPPEFLMDKIIFGHEMCLVRLRFLDD